MIYAASLIVTHALSHTYQHTETAHSPLNGTRLPSHLLCVPPLNGTRLPGYLLRVPPLNRTRLPRYILRVPPHSMEQGYHAIYCVSHHIQWNTVTTLSIACPTTEWNKVTRLYIACPTTFNGTWLPDYHKRILSWFPTWMFPRVNLLRHQTEAGKAGRCLSSSRSDRFHATSSTQLPPLARGVV